MAEKKEKTENIIGSVEALGSYVYLYIDPRNKKPFYAGMGKGRRLLTHLDVPDKAITKRISEIRKSGEEPRIDILRWGLSKEVASEVEAAVIELIGKENLVNCVSGHTRGRKRISGQELDAIINPKPVKVRHKSVLFNLVHHYHEDMTRLDGTTTDALYECAHGPWPASIRRVQEYQYAIAVARGIVREVYFVDDWYEAKEKGRICFHGTVAKDIRGRYVKRRYDGWAQGARHPVRYEELT